MRWLYHPPSEVALEKLGRAAAVSPVIAELLILLGLEVPEEAAAFLRPSLANIGDPFALTNLKAAAERLVQAIDRKETIVVLGDYDVDGVSSSALLVSILRRFGLHPRFIVPRRMEDGYGLSRSAIDRAFEAGVPQVFIALDCGTNAHAEVAYLRSRGCEVLIVDHHRSTEEQATEALLINPHVYPTDGDDAWRDLCTVGLVFKLVHGLLKLLRAANHPTAFDIKLRDYLDFVAMGTVADLVPLTGENRTMARFGLKTLCEGRRCGLRALMDVSGIRAGQTMMPVDISFRLGPRINASGRLADAALSVELLLSDDDGFCRATARQLDTFNRERQDIERQIVLDAERVIERDYLNDPAIVLYGDEWHPGVVGIVAGRVTRKYNRPCVVLGNEGELAKGSGRSVNGVNLVDALGECASDLESWGGHPMAVGVALNKDRLDSFRVRFAEAVRQQIGGAQIEAELMISTWITLEQVRESLMKELELMHPFGQANPEPVFGLRGVMLHQTPVIFKDFHFRFQLEDARGRRLFGVAWKQAQRVPPVGQTIDLAVKLSWNYFQDRKLLQLELIDWRLSPA